MFQRSAQPYLSTEVPDHPSDERSPVFSPIGRPLFHLSITNLPSTFRILTFANGRTVDRPFIFRISLLVGSPSLSLTDLLCHMTFLRFSTSKGNVRNRFRRVRRHRRNRTTQLYHIHLKPGLTYLNRHFDRQVFDTHSIPRVLHRILGRRKVINGS